MSYEFDVTVIGGGPGGYVAAIRAAQLGADVTVVEKQYLGGTCLNVGCIPTKCLLHSAELAEDIRTQSQTLGIRVQGMEVDFPQVIAHKNSVSSKLSRGVASLLKMNKVTVVSGEAAFTGVRTLRVDKPDGSQETLSPDAVILSTGSVNAVPPIPGLKENENCIDSTGALSLQELPETMVVIGAGVIGLELACAFAAYGTEVTVVEMLPEIMPHEQPEAVRILVKDLENRGIALKTGGKMLRIEKKGTLLRAVYELDGREQYTDCEQVLMAAGRKTNLTGIDAQALGLALDKKRCIVVDDRQRTNLPGVYAIGDVVGGYQLAHAAYAEGEAALADMLGQDRPYGAVPVPVCTYTIPCFASVGLTTQGAKDAGYNPVLGSFDYGANGMALAEGAAGAVFVVADRATGRTLGVTIVGENASEMIAMATSAVADGLTTRQWEEMVVAHPSLCEMVREAALDAFGASVHKG